MMPFNIRGTPYQSKDSSMSHSKVWQTLYLRDQLMYYIHALPVVLPVASEHKLTLV